MARQLGDIEPRRHARRYPEASARHLASEGEPLKVKEPHGPLEIGEGGRLGGREPLEFPPAGELEAQHVHERDVVALQHPKQHGNVAGNVVDDLGPGRKSPP